jgi:Holliday junction resolvase
MKTITQKHASGIALERRARAAINDLGGQAVRMPGSGAMAEFKGDLEINLGDARFKAECKKSMTRNLKIKAEWLEKITREALASNRKPALIFAWQRGPIMVAMPKVNFRKSFLVLTDPVVSKFNFLKVNDDLPAEFSFSFSKFPALGTWQTMGLEGWVHSCWMQEQSE